ncbi:MAG TPA: hypothetical protein VF337_07965 [Candidatus Limnocylindrales bacterium]
MVDPNAAWAPQAPVVDPNAAWQPQLAAAQPTYGTAYGQPQMQRPKSGGKVWQILSLVLVLLLLVVGGGLGFAFISTSGTLDTTKKDLAAEQAKHKSDNAAWSACVASMKTDGTALTDAVTALAAVTNSPATGGEIDLARAAYETQILAAEADFRTSAYDFSWSTNQTEWAVAVKLFDQAKTEIAAAAALQTTLEGLISDYTDAVSAAQDKVTAAQAQMDKTSTKCAAANSASK